MGKIDFSRVITAETHSRDQRDQRAQRVKAECTRRMALVLDPLTVSNLHGAALIGDLGTDEIAVFQSGQRWLAQMRLTCRALIDDNSADFENDASWPPVPDGLDLLSAAY